MEGIDILKSFVGTVIVAEPQFCYVVTPKVMVRQEFSYNVSLPDGTVDNRTYDQFDLVEHGSVAGFYVNQGLVME